MSAISKRILSNVSAPKTAVKIEKASADASNGVAKILFSMNLPAHKAVVAAKNPSEMETAFAAHFGDKAHIVTSSIHKSEQAGLFVGFVKLNRPMVDHEDAVKDESGYSLVAANVFADANDDIWEVKEVSGKKVLVRNSQEDILELFNKVAPTSNMSVAASTIQMTGKLEFASLVTYLDPVTEYYRDGIVLDTATVYDAKAKKAVTINPVTAIATSGVYPALRRDLSARYGDNHSTFSELASTNIQAVYDYLEALYGQMPAFLAAYKEAIRRVLDMK